MSDNGGQKSWNPTFEYKLKHGPNDRLGNNQPLRGWKAQLYEGGIRVPALIYGAEIPSRVKVDDVTSANDIFPTLAVLAQAPISTDMKIEGINILPIIKGKRKFEGRILYWRTRSQLALRKGDWKLIHHGESPGEGIDELYCLADDPYKEKNVANNFVEKLDELKKELIDQFSKDEQVLSQ